MTSARMSRSDRPFLLERKKFSDARARRGKEQASAADLGLGYVVVDHGGGKATISLLRCYVVLERDEPAPGTASRLSRPSVLRCQTSAERYCAARVAVLPTPPGPMSSEVCRFCRRRSPKAILAAAAVSSAMSHSPSSGSWPASWSLGLCLLGTPLALFFTLLGVERSSAREETMSGISRSRRFQPVGIDICSVGGDGVVEKVQAAAASAMPGIDKRQSEAAPCQRHGTPLATPDQIFTPAVPAPGAVSGFHPLLRPGFCRRCGNRDRLEPACCVAHSTSRRRASASAMEQVAARDFTQLAAVPLVRFMGVQGGHQCATNCWPLPRNSEFLALSSPSNDHREILANGASHLNGMARLGQSPVRGEGIRPFPQNGCGPALRPPARRWGHRCRCRMSACAQ